MRKKSDSGLQEEQAAQRLSRDTDPEVAEVASAEEQDTRTTNKLRQLSESVTNAHQPVGNMGTARNRLHQLAESATRRPADSQVLTQSRAYAYRCPADSGCCCWR